MSTLSEGTWLEPCQQEVALAAGRSMLLAIQKSGLRVKPKLHMLAHIVHDLVPQAGRPCVNPWANSVWMDEDFIGKICRMIVALGHPAHLSTKLLQRYCAKLIFILE